MRQAVNSSLPKGRRSLMTLELRHRRTLWKNGSTAEFVGGELIGSWGLCPQTPGIFGGMARVFDG